MIFSGIGLITLTLLPEVQVELSDLGDVREEEQLPSLETEIPEFSLDSDHGSCI